MVRKNTSSARTGWSSGVADPGNDDGGDARDLYDELRQRLPLLFYERRVAWRRVIPRGRACNASFFNMHRMVWRYLMHSFALGDET